MSAHESVGERGEGSPAGLEAGCAAIMYGFCYIGLQRDMVRTREELGRRLDGLLSDWHDAYLFAKAARQQFEACETRGRTRATECDFQDLVLGQVEIPLSARTGSGTTGLGF
jgi:hypothetical protein